MALLCAGYKENSPSPEQNGEPQFHRFGESWTLTFEGKTIQLADMVGLRYVAHLLGSPGKSFHALELVQLVKGLDATPVLGSAGAVADARALGEYKARLVDIQEELAEAERNNDLGRMASIKDERAALAEQIEEATGVGGRHQGPPMTARGSANLSQTRFRAVSRLFENTTPPSGGTSMLRSSSVDSSPTPQKNRSAG